MSRQNGKGWEKFTAHGQIRILHLTAASTSSDPRARCLGGRVLWKPVLVWSWVWRQKVNRMGRGSRASVGHRVRGKDAKQGIVRGNTVDGARFGGKVGKREKSRYLPDVCAMRRLLIHAKKNHARGKWKICWLVHSCFNLFGNLDWGGMSILKTWVFHELMWISIKPIWAFAGTLGSRQEPLGCPTGLLGILQPSSALWANHGRWRAHCVGLSHTDEKWQPKRNRAVAQPSL